MRMLHKSLLWTLLAAWVCCCFHVTSHAHFVDPKLRAKMPRFFDLNTAQKNNSVILYGNSSIRREGNQIDDLYRLTQLDNNRGYDFEKLEHHNPPYNLKDPGGLVYDAQTDSVFLLSSSVSNNEYYTTALNTTQLQVFRYDFPTQTWSHLNPPSVVTGTNWPVERIYFALIHDRDANQAYLCGGTTSAAGMPEALKDMWRMDMAQGSISFTRLEDMALARSYHQMAWITDHEFLLIGGTFNYYPSPQSPVPLASAEVFNTRDAKWNNRTAIAATHADLPNGLSFHAAAADLAHGRVLVFGGYAIGTRDLIPFGLLVLNLSTWSWEVPKTMGIPPNRRAAAKMYILNPSYLTVAWGDTYPHLYNDMDVLNLDKLKWIETFSAEEMAMDKPQPGLNVSTTSIAIVIPIVAIMVLFLIFCRRRVRLTVRRMTNLRKLTWRPREGEPMWTEIARKLSILVCFIVFLCILNFAIPQVMMSPTITQVSTEPVTSMGVPDVRFCYKSEQDSALIDTQIKCTTSFGDECTNYIQVLDVPLFNPSVANRTKAFCNHFRPPTNFTLSNAEEFLYRTSVRFTITYFLDANATASANRTTPAEIPKLYVSLYPRDKDPNIIYYNDTPTDEDDKDDTSLTPKEIDDWIISEQWEIMDKNTFEVDLGKYSTVTFKNVVRKTLTPTAWNHVGLYPDWRSSESLDSSYSSHYAHSIQLLPGGDINTIVSVEPEHFETVMEREFKVYTAVNALGIVGGIAGVLISIQACLFGFRPKSPWGIVQRLSFGPVRRSLLQALQSRFETQEVPLLSTKVLRSQTNLPVEDRFEHVEERMWVLEQMLAAYHLNNEVFQRLDEALTSSRQPTSLDSAMETTRLNDDMSKM